MNGRNLAYAREKANLTQEQLGELLGTTQNTVWRWENSGVNPRDGMKKKIAEILNTSVAFLMDETDLEEAKKHIGISNSKTNTQIDVFPDTQEEASIRHNNRRIAGVNDLLMVPMISPEVRVSAGCGNDYSNSNLEFTEVGKYPVFDGQLAALYSNDGLLSMIVDGDSMEPQIHDGDVIIFDHDSNWVSGCIYVVCLDGRMLVKGLIKENGDDAPLLRSSNKSYSDIHIKQGQGFTVYGRVLKIDTTRRPKPII